MKLPNCKSWLPSGPTLALLAGVMGLTFGVIPAANATPAFARSTGAECVKCHTLSFPRLNWMGERFFRNGFALPSEGKLDLGEFPDEKQPVKEKRMKDLVLKDVGDIFSVRGQFAAYDKTENNPQTSVGSPATFYIFASAQIADNVPIWAEGEVSTDTGEFEVHNYFIGRTNIAGSTLGNVRMGGFTPTDWTSLSDQKRSLDSVNSHPGAYRGQNGFTMVAAGLGGKTGVEYYGYTEMLFWALGYGDDGANFDTANPAENEDKNMWAVGRFDFLKGSSVSLLYFNAGEVGTTGEDLIAYVLSANYRMGNKIDVTAQYSMDNSSDTVTPTRDDVTGYTLQADWQVIDHWMGIVRYDTTDNGLSVRSKETQATLAAVWAPYQNVKFTGFYAMELDRAQFANASPTDRGVEETDLYGLQLQFAF